MRYFFVVKIFDPSEHLERDILGFTLAKSV